MFDSPTGFGPQVDAVAAASLKLRDTIDFVPNGHEEVKDYFLDISMALVIAAAATGSEPQAVVEILDHLDGVVRDVYSRLEVRL